jgi:predicted Zn-ribbon and HTH transcriptional regulator
MAIGQISTILSSTRYYCLWIKTCKYCGQTFSGKEDKAPAKCPGCGTKW